MHLPIKILVIAATSMLISACYPTAITPTKTKNCQRIAYQFHAMSWQRPEPTNYHTNLDKQRLIRQWHQYQCDKIKSEQP